MIFHSYFSGVRYFPCLLWYVCDCVHAGQGFILLMHEFMVHLEQGVLTRKENLPTEFCMLLHVIISSGRDRSCTSHNVCIIYDHKNLWNFTFSSIHSMHMQNTDHYGCTSNFPLIGARSGVKSWMISRCEGQTLRHDNHHDKANAAYCKWQSSLKAGMYNMSSSTMTSKISAIFLYF